MWYLGNEQATVRKCLPWQVSLSHLAQIKSLSRHKCCLLSRPEGLLYMSGKYALYDRVRFVKRSVFTSNSLLYVKQMNDIKWVKSVCFLMYGYIPLSVNKGVYILRLILAQKPRFFRLRLHQHRIHKHWASRRRTDRGYNTLDFASKIVCQMGCVPLWIPPLHFRLCWWYNSSMRLSIIVPKMQISIVYILIANVDNAYLYSISILFSSIL